VDVSTPFTSHTEVPTMADPAEITPAEDVCALPPPVALEFRYSSKAPFQRGLL
jgi:hypothetical protein